MWVTEGLLWERDHPGKANWQVIEPSRGNYNWTIIDNYVRSAQASGVQILFTIWPFTDWDQLICNSDLPEEPPLPIGAAEKGKDPGGFSELSRRRGKPCDMNVYQDYLRFLVERYDGDGDNDMAGLRYPVKYWEVGNEPELDFFFQGTPQDYFEPIFTPFFGISHKTENSQTSPLHSIYNGFNIPSISVVTPKLNTEERFHVSIIPPM